MSDPAQDIEYLKGQVKALHLMVSLVASGIYDIDSKAGDILVSGLDTFIFQGNAVTSSSRTAFSNGLLNAFKDVRDTVLESRKGSHNPS